MNIFVGETHIFYHFPGFRLGSPGAFVSKTQMNLSTPGDPDPAQSGACDRAGGESGGPPVSRQGGRPLGAGLV